MKKSISLGAQFAFIFAVLMAILSLILSIFIGVKSSKQVKREIGRSLSETSFQMADKLDQYMWARSGEIEILKELEALKNPDDLEEISLLLNKLKSTFESFSWIGFTDPKGVVKASTDDILKNVDISERPVYMEGIKGHFIGDVHDAVLLSKLLPNPTGEPMKFVDISTTVYDDDGKVTGVLAAHLSWKWAKEIEESILKPLHKHKNIEIFIISDKDKSVLLGPKKLLGKKFELESIEKAYEDKNGWVIETWPDGKEYLTGFSKADGYMNYKGLDWTILVRQPSETAYLPVKTLQNYILTFGSALTILFALIGWLVAGRVVKPLNEITIAADKLANGEDTVIPVSKGIKDIEILSISLRNLISTLTYTENALVEMEGIANHDALTGLPNRVALKFYMDNKLSKIKAKDSTIAFLYMDLDGFKSVNDTFGHDAGDEVLKQTANRIKGNIRNEEIVARLGGDEFLVILFTSSTSFREDVTKVSERIINDLNKEFIIGDKKTKIGCSIGASIWPLDSEDMTEAINLADEALYESKRLEKNRLTFYMDFKK